ncbi:MAG: 30S ribosomal protein S12 methylthiotransferase RimO [Nitrospina sp.]|jgi:ribosomal protein S12 methylthiotransferase|nr:30S ribosomal protein S12 methylthiotransferase RimO [Nitrospina sp.]
MKKVGMVSLGCPKNTVDSERVLGDLVSSGYDLTQNEEDAEILIVNTCGFIESAKKESIDTILEMARQKTDGKCQQLIVTGCLAERHTQELLDEIPEIDHLLGVGQYPQLKNILDKDGANFNNRNHVATPAEYYESYTDRLMTTAFYTAYVKISEGCSNRCAFCIIPKMRGPMRSRSPESILAEAENLAKRGVKEFNIISQDTTMYGFDLAMKDGLARLLKDMAKIDGVEWLRLLYCYPTFLNSNVIDYIASEEKVCRYIDVPLQHTHDEMLKSMKRQETEGGVRKMLEELRLKIPKAALRTTFITGFPGETEEHFKHMLRFLCEMQFDHVGIFTYSDEEGTTAFDYPNRVPEEVKEERKNILMEFQKEIALRKNQEKVGQILPVLVEGFDAQENYIMTGRLASQAPDIDGQVILEKCEAEPGEIIPVRITAAADYDLVAEPISQPVELVE